MGNVTSNWRIKCKSTCIHKPMWIWTVTRPMHWGRFISYFTIQGGILKGVGKFFYTSTLRLSKVYGFYQPLHSKWTNDFFKKRQHSHFWSQRSTNLPGRQGHTGTSHQHPLLGLCSSSPSGSAFCWPRHPFVNLALMGLPLWISYRLKGNESKCDLD